MNGTFEQILKAGKEACIEHGFSSIGVYQTQNEANVQDGWDRFIISPVHVSESEYKYLGFVRANGEFVGRHLTQRVPDGAWWCPQPCNRLHGVNQSNCVVCGSPRR